MAGERRTGIGRDPTDDFYVDSGPCTNCGQDGEVVTAEVIGNVTIIYDSAQPLSEEWYLCIGACLPALQASDWETLAARKTR